MAQGGKFSGKATELIFKALEQVPNSVSGLWLAGMAKAEIGEIAEAMQYWRQLEAILAPRSKALRELQNLMSSVQADKSSAPPVVEESTLASAISVKVQVTMDTEIKAKVSPDDIVFIYAKALTGPPMPLASVRKKVSDLPLSVTLDDTMAMMPTMKLSNFKKVKILARISKSGNARQQKGDFVGSLDLQKLVINTSISIVISDEIK
jgi:cytochrome c-type biogenesis protein CcmH